MIELIKLRTMVHGAEPAGRRPNERFIVAVRAGEELAIADGA